MERRVAAREASKMSSKRGMTLLTASAVTSIAASLTGLPRHWSISVYEGTGDMKALRASSALAVPLTAFLMNLRSSLLLSYPCAARTTRDERVPITAWRGVHGS